MVDAVNTTAIVTYQNNMQLALQPMGGELVDACLNWDLAGKGELVDLEDFFGAVQTVTVRDRHVPQIPTDGTQDRVWLAKPQPDYYDKLVNKQDQLAAGIELQGGYVMQGSAAIKRYWNQQFLTGFFSARQTGKTGTVVSAFPAGQVVPVNAGWGAGGSNHMNVEKFLQARQLLMLGNADFNQEDAYIILTPIQITDLLREVQVTSDEFKALGGAMSPDGKKLLRFLGFNIIELNLADPFYANRIDTTFGVANQRRNPFWLKSGVGIGFWERLFTDITIRSDLHYETQVYARSCGAATRTQDGLSGYILNFEA
jgi:hypothetical protein